MFALSAMRVAKISFSLYSGAAVAGTSRQSAATVERRASHTGGPLREKVSHIQAQICAGTENTAKETSAVVGAALTQQYMAYDSSVKVHSEVEGVFTILCCRQKK